MNTRISLAQLAPRLRPVFQNDCPTYRKLYSMVLDGSLPMKSEPGRRGYFIEESELPGVVAIVQAVLNKRISIAA